MRMDITYHYPPELLQLLVAAIPRLCPSKPDVLLFFRGAGVAESFLTDIRRNLAADKASVKKFDMVRTVLVRLNERGEGTLRERREVLKRVTEFENFSTCWPNDQLEAQGLVAQIRHVVNVKDSFTRMNIERGREAADRKAEVAARATALTERRDRLAKAHREFGAAVAETEPQRRGRLLEKAANELFRAHGILVRESFRVVDDKDPGVVEQIDGVIELDGLVYLVEMKWLNGCVGVGDVSRHLVRVYHRGQTRGLFVSATEFTDTSIATCRDALQKTVVALALVEELVLVTERDSDLQAFLREKVRIAQIERIPFVRLDPDRFPFKPATARVAH